MEINIDLLVMGGYIFISSNFAIQWGNLWYIYIYCGCDRVFLGAGHKAKRMGAQCINGVSSNPVEREQKIVTSKI